MPALLSQFRSLAAGDVAACQGLVFVRMVTLGIEVPLCRLQVRHPSCSLAHRRALGAPEAQHAEVADDAPGVLPVLEPLHSLQFPACCASRVLKYVVQAAA